MFSNRFKQGFLSQQSSLISDCSLFRDAVSFCVEWRIQIRDCLKSPLVSHGVSSSGPSRSLSSDADSSGSCLILSCGAILPRTSLQMEGGCLSRIGSSEGPVVTSQVHLPTAHNQRRNTTTNKGGYHVLIALLMLSPMPSNTMGKGSYYAHFIDEQPEAQRS